MCFYSYFHIESRIYFPGFIGMKKTPELFDISNKWLKQIEFSHWVLPQICVWEFRWYFEWVNLWQEISKDGGMKRPCLIVKSIPHSSLIWIIPTTSKIKEWKRYQMNLNDRSHHGLKKASALLIYQLKCIDKKRLVKKIEGKNVTWWFLKYIFSKYFLQ